MMLQDPSFFHMYMLFLVWAPLIPVMRGNTVEYTLGDETPGGMLLGLLPLDSDLGRTIRPETLRDVTYRLSNEEPPALSGYFEVDAKSGALRTIRVLDRDAVCPGAVTCRARMLVQVRGGVTQSLLGLLQVSVDVKDDDDNRPRFAEQNIEIFVSEGAVVGTRLDLPQALDTDSPRNGIAKYVLHSADRGVSGKLTLSKFELVEARTRENDEHGEDDEVSDLYLSLIGPLDRETQHKYDLELIVYERSSVDFEYDEGQRVWDVKKGGEREVKINITVMVTDINDNVPTFNDTVYIVTVPEDVISGTSVYRVHASDADIGSNSEITYAIHMDRRKLTRIPGRNGGIGGADGGVEGEGGGGEGGKAPKGLFQIDAHSGVIFVNGALDYETQSVHTLLITARDSGPTQGSCRLMIRLIDINDNRPKIILDISTDSQHLDGSPIYQVSEATPIGSFIAHVTVKDADSGELGRVTCSVSEPSLRIEKLFEEAAGGQSTQYKLVTATALDRERISSYDVTLTCADSAAQPLTGSADLVVLVADENDNYPQFTQTAYVVNVTENNHVGLSLMTLMALDTDLGENAVVHFEFDSRCDSLRLDKNSGIIYANVEFDRETTSAINCRVIATNPSPYLLSARGLPDVSWTVVNVEVVDVDDEMPTFSRNVYLFEVDEDLKQGATVGQLSAVDRDLPPYNLFHYIIDMDDSDENDDTPIANHSAPASVANNEDGDISDENDGSNDLSNNDDDDDSSDIDNNANWRYDEDQDTNDDTSEDDDDDEHDTYHRRSRRLEDLLFVDPLTGWITLLVEARSLPQQFTFVAFAVPVPPHDDSLIRDSSVLAESREAGKDRVKCCRHANVTLHVTRKTKMDDDYYNVTLTFLDYYNNNNNNSKNNKNNKNNNNNNNNDMRSTDNNRPTVVLGSRTDNNVIHIRRDLAPGEIIARVGATRAKNRDEPGREIRTVAIKNKKREQDKREQEQKQRQVHSTQSERKKRKEKKPNEDQRARTLDITQEFALTNVTLGGDVTDVIDITHVHGMRDASRYFNLDRFSGVLKLGPNFEELLSASSRDQSNERSGDDEVIRCSITIMVTDTRHRVTSRRRLSIIVENQSSKKRPLIFVVDGGVSILIAILTGSSIIVIICVVAIVWVAHRGGGEGSCGKGRGDIGGGGRSLIHLNQIVVGAKTGTYHTNICDIDDDYDNNEGNNEDRSGSSGTEIEGGLVGRRGGGGGGDEAGELLSDLQGSNQQNVSSSSASVKSHRINGDVVSFSIPISGSFRIDRSESDEECSDFLPPPLGSPPSTGGSDSGNYSSAPEENRDGRGHANENTRQDRVNNLTSCRYNADCCGHETIFKAGIEPHTPRLSYLKAGETLIENNYYHTPLPSSSESTNRFTQEQIILSPLDPHTADYAPEKWSGGASLTISPGHLIIRNKLRNSSRGNFLEEEKSRVLESRKSPCPNFTTIHSGSSASGELSSWTSPKRVTLRDSCEFARWRDRRLSADLHPPIIVEFCGDAESECASYV